MRSYVFAFLFFSAFIVTEDVFGHCMALNERDAKQDVGRLDE
jgi:hypothetical protein